MRLVGVDTRVHCKAFLSSTVDIRWSIHNPQKKKKLNTVASILYYFLCIKLLMIMFRDLVFLWCSLNVASDAYNDAINVSNVSNLLAPFLVLRLAHCHRTILHSPLHNASSHSYQHKLKMSSVINIIYIDMETSIKKSIME